MNWQPKSDTPPPNYRYGPRYRPSWHTIAYALFFLITGKRRSLARHSGYILPDMPVPPLVRGMDHIPERGPLVVVANHYERPGMWMVWPALFAGQAIWERAGDGPAWIAIAEWESFSMWGIPIPPWLTRAVFQRTFDTFGLLAMAPPYVSASARAHSVRSATGAIKEGRIVGIMPEGDVGATPELLPAREGVGTFLLFLARAGAPILPLGLYEENDRLVAHFGAPFTLEPPAQVAREDRDAWARDRVMRAIRDLLPEPLWGVYR